MRPAIDLQLKATVKLNPAGNRHYRFKLNRRNYDLLRIQTQTPRVLVVLDLPRYEDQWIKVTTDELALRRCAYWLSLVGADETDNRSSVTVLIPMENVFDVKNLRLIMDRGRFTARRLRFLPHPVIRAGARGGSDCSAVYRAPLPCA